MADADRTVWSACTVNCGSRCPLRLQVKDGTVVRVLSDNTGDDELGSQRVLACVRGRSIRHRIYNPDRLKKPMKRKPGTKRGEEQWEEISWEQALDEITDKMKEIKADYGNEAFYINYGTGVLGSTMACSWPPDATPFARLMNTWGGYLDHYSDYSTTEITQAYPYFYGGWVNGNSFDDAANAKLQVMFGNNPLETRMSGGGQLAVTQMTKKKHGVRTIVIDPRYSETAAVLGDDWVALRPGTDAALIAGMIHVMLAEDLQDQEFLDRYTVGFDEHTLPESAPANSSYRAYIEGRGPDGVEKSPEWAAGITGVPAQRIRQIAREIATAKPCAITQGWGPQRHANGENNARAIFLLACVIGSVGIPGGGTGAREGAQALPFVKTFYANGPINPSNKIISVFSWLDAIDHGPEMDTFNAGVCEKPAPGVRANKVPVDENGEPTNTKLDVPIKMVWQYGGNSIVNQTGDNNRSVEILQDDSKCELIVVCDIQYTVSARYADYILPGTSTAEEFDIHPGENAGPMAYGIISEQAIEPLYECKSIFDICTEMAKRLGTEPEFTEGKSREDWLRETIEATRANDPDLPDYDTWRDVHGCDGWGYEDLLPYFRRHWRARRAEIHPVEEIGRMPLGKKRNTLRKQGVVDLALIVGNDAVADLGERHHLPVGRQPLRSEQRGKRSAENPDHRVVAVDEDAVDDVLHQIGGERRGTGDDRHEDKGAGIAPSVLATVGGEEARDELARVIAEQVRQSFRERGLGHGRTIGVSSDDKMAVCQARGARRIAPV